MEQKKHFVLVHGACHGAWTWYKIKPLLEEAGHRVTVLDMAGAGVNRKAIQEVKSLVEYSEPLLKTMSSCVGQNEKVILVGHSFGGMSLAMAMEKFPDKIEASVFLTAFAPDTLHKPSYVLHQFVENAKEIWWDTQFSSYESTVDKPLTSFLFGPKCLAEHVYQLSPSEDLALANSLLRPGSLFIEELEKAEKFTEKNYGSVKKVYVICSEDKTITKEFQKWMIQNYGIENVMEIDGADHMAMFSKPLQVSHCLLRVAKKFN